MVAEPKVKRHPSRSYFPHQVNGVVATICPPTLGGDVSRRGSVRQAPVLVLFESMMNQSIYPVE